MAKEEKKGSKEPEDKSGIGPSKITKLADGSAPIKQYVPKKEERYWDWRFAPCYTPFEVAEMGGFEGKYWAAIPDIPSKYLNLPKVIKDRKQPGNYDLNKFGIMSRQLLSEWRKKGWLTKLSPLGHLQWYLHYFEHGRRNEKEDNLQIGRWSSFVSRHQGQINKNCKKGDKNCRPKQRQGLLQWYWDSDKPRTAELHKRNVRRMAKLTGSQLEEGWEKKVDAMYSKFSKEGAKPESAMYWGSEYD